jgi:hypothetical protein
MTVVALVVAVMLASSLPAGAKKAAPPPPTPEPSPAPAPDATGGLYCGATVGGCGEGIIADEWFCTEYPTEWDCQH